MSGFVTNIARRGAGLAPTLAPRQAPRNFDGAADRLPNPLADDPSMSVQAPNADSASQALIIGMPSPPSSARHSSALNERASHESQPQETPETSEHLETTRVEKPATAATETRPTLPVGTLRAPIETLSEPVHAAPIVPASRPNEHADEPSPHIMVVPSAPVREEKTGDEIEIPRLSPAAVVQIREPLEPRLRETWDADVAPIRPGQTGVSSVDSNEPRIQVHIGQIELRVHKRDPARRVSPQRAKPRLDEFALARKYLDRIY